MKRLAQQEVHAFSFWASLKANVVKQKVWELRYGTSNRGSRNFQIPDRGASVRGTAFDVVDNASIDLQITSVSRDLIRTIYVITWGALCGPNQLVPRSPGRSRTHVDAHPQNAQHNCYRQQDLCARLVIHAMTSCSRLLRLHVLTLSDPSWWSPSFTHGDNPQLLHLSGHHF